MTLFAIVDPHTLKEITDHAAGMDDRWLFIASQIIIIAGMGYAIKLLAGFVKDQQSKLNTLVEQHAALNQRALDAIDASNKQGNETAGALREVAQEIKFCRVRNQTT